MLLKPTSVAEYDGHPIDIYDASGIRWIRGGQVCHSLGVTDRTLKRIVRQHRKEFTAELTQIVTVPTSGGSQQARVFSPRGAALVAMLTNSPRAAAFRVWVLDTLEARVADPAPSPALPPPDMVAVPKALVSTLARLTLHQKPELRRVLAYRRRGFSVAETAKMLDRHPRTVTKDLRVLEVLGLIDPAPAEVRARAVASAAAMRTRLQGGGAHG
ncbi:MAG: Ralstonia phage [Pseudomonadota bacterium]